MPKLITVVLVNAHVTGHIPFFRDTNSLLNKLITPNNIWRNENGEDYIKVRFEGCTLCPAQFWRDMRWMKDMHIKYLGQGLGLFLQPTLMHNSITTCMSHYYPRHVSGLHIPILRRNNCTNTASGILALIRGCTLHRLRADYAESALNRCCLQPLMRARIPYAVFVQLFLLRMGMSRPETCRG